MDRLLEKDWVLKLISLFLAIILWSEVIGTQNPIITQSISVPIQVTHVVSGEVAQISPASVTVLLKGPKLVMDRITKKEISASADSQGRTGSFRAPVAIQIPSGVVLQNSSPEQVSLLVQPITKETQRIHVLLTGKPAKGETAILASQTAPTVTISGPADQVASVVKVQAQVVVQGAAVSFSQTVPVVAVDKFGRQIKGLTLNPDHVGATVRVGKVLKKSVAITGRVTGTPAAGFTLKSIKVSPSLLNVTGAAAAVSALSNIDTALVDINGAKKDVVKELTIQLPAGVRAIGGTKVTVTAVIAPTPKPAVKPKAPAKPVTGPTPAA